MDHIFETHLILETIVAAVFLGILAQVVAHRFKLPAILPLLILGMACGPSGLKLFHPGSLGNTLEVIVHLGVAVILFEGGLSLDLNQLRQIGGPLRNLLTVGTAVTGVGAAVIAHWAVGVSWPTAALFGAIVTVTGPTVIQPLLRHMVAPKKVRTLLLSEGLMIDPIGAVLAYLVLQWIERAGLGFRSVFVELLGLAVTGSILGLVAGFMAVQAVKRRFLSEELRNLVILALLFGAFLWAELQAETSGILAAVVMGLVVSFAHIPDMSPLKAFKGQLTVLFISVLFILLSGQLDLNAMRELGWEGALVVVGLILIVRPLSVFASIPGKAFDLREKTLVALTAPRGIVAAAVASLSAIALRDHGQQEDAVLLEGLVYLTILATCTWATIMATWLPRWLGYDGDPSRRRVVMVGANGLSTALSKLFRERQWTVVVVDGVRSKLATLQKGGIVGVPGDARDAVTYENAGVERDAQLLAMTTNDELNLLVAELVRDEFGVEHPVVLVQQRSEEFGSLRRAWADVLSGQDLNLPAWSRRLEDGTAELRTIDLPQDEIRRQMYRSLIAEGSRRVVQLIGWHGHQPIFDPREDEFRDAKTVTVMMTPQGAEELDSILEGERDESGADGSANGASGEGDSEGGEAEDGKTDADDRSSLDSPGDGEPDAAAERPAKL
ncbi:MAG: sodium:proton antiporter [Acidobacteriota bacterium]